MSVSSLTIILCRNASTTTRQATSQKSRALLSKILRVDHAGELGAVRIYEGQLAVLGRTKEGPLIKVSMHPSTDIG